MDQLSALASLAPYGLAPLGAAYGAYRMARGTKRTLPGRRVARRKIPRSIRIRGTHSFRRSTQLTMAYTPTTGVAYGTGTGNGFAMMFSLSQITIKVGTGVGSAAIQGSTELTNLFDKWRLTGATVRVFFQDNYSATSVNTTNMPLLNYVWDTSDNTIEDLNAICQHPNVNRYQWGNGATRSGCLMTRGRPLSHLGTGDFTTGATTSAGSRPERYGTWFDTAQPDITHFGLKGVFDPIGATLATSEGTFSFYIDCFYEAKDVI